MRSSSKLTLVLFIRPFLSLIFTVYFLEFLCDNSQAELLFHVNLIMFLKPLAPFLYLIWIKNKNSITNEQSNQILHILICFAVITMFSTKHNLPKHTCKWRTWLHTLTVRWTTYRNRQVRDNLLKLLVSNSVILHMPLICGQLYLINRISQLWVMRWACW